ncbi:MAG: SprB repeat-containing protein [Bacteroidia bacterium]|nr:SprB repeat-containing protein [Bacteroidia bacterium]
MWNTSPAQTSQTAVLTQPGAYTVTVTDANGCTTTGSITTTFPFLVASVTNIINAGCAVGSATAQVSGGVSPYSYTWSNGETTQTAVNLLAGVFTLQVTGANGCVSAPVSFTITSTTVTIPNGILANPHLENVTSGKPDYWYATNTCTDPVNLSNLPSSAVLSVYSSSNAAPGDGCKGTDLPMNTTSSPILPTYFVQKQLGSITVLPNSVYMMEVRIKTDNGTPGLTRNDYDIDLITELTPGTLATGTKWDFKTVHSLNPSGNTLPADWQVYRIMFSTEKYYTTQTLLNAGFRFFTDDAYRGNITTHVDGIVLDRIDDPSLSFRAPDNSPYIVQSFTSGSGTSSGNYLGTSVTFYEKTVTKTQFSDNSQVFKVFQFEQSPSQQPALNHITRYNYNDANDLPIMGNIVLQPYSPTAI